MTKKCCPTCKETKLAEAFFYKDRTTKDGYASQCKACKQKTKNQTHAARPVKITLMKARNRASKKGLPFALVEADFLPLPRLCPVLRHPLDYTRGSKGHAKPNSPSLDRINPELGYVKGNVMIISHRANTLKRDATREELQAVVNYLTLFEN